MVMIDVRGGVLVGAANVGLVALVELLVLISVV